MEKTGRREATRDRDLAGTHTVINSTSADLNSRLELVRPYVQLMSLMRELLLTEISYVRGVMSDEEVSEQYKNLDSPLR
jgi:hypothetical protein